jgi:hypothetical protein
MSWRKIREGAGDLPFSHEQSRCGAFSGIGYIPSGTDPPPDLPTAAFEASWHEVLNESGAGDEIPVCPS